MTENPSVNRSLKDKSMDHIDHALGRPVDPLGDTYRNHFSAGTGTTLSIAFAASPNWELTSQDGRMSFFSVTRAGRKALADHLKSIRDPWQSYVVVWNDATCILAATSEADAKKRAYSSASDAYSDLTFRQFDREVSVRRVSA